MTVAVSSGLSVERTLANSHTLFNVINVIIYLPFTRPLAALFTRMIPDIPELVLFPELKITNTVDLDMKQEYQKSRESLVKCIRLIRQTLGSLNKQYEALDWNRLEDIALQDELLNRGYREVRNHAVMLYRLATDNHVKTLFADTIRIVELIERLGDDFSRSLIRILRKLLSENLILSMGSVAELEALNHRFSGILDELSLGLIYSDEYNPDTLNEHIDAVDQKLSAMRRAHFQSLADNVPAAVASSSQYLDILSEMESSVAKIKNIAKLVKEDKF
jgi:phosphate:Na+ symporter